jgi:GTPase SAR1 family protein
MADFQSAVEQLRSVVAEVRPLLSDAEVIARLDQESAELDRHIRSHSVFSVGMVGPSNSGKTTITKALFFNSGLKGVDLPIKAVTSTQAPTIIRLRKTAEQGAVIERFSRGECVRLAVKLLNTLPLEGGEPKYKVIESDIERTLSQLPQPSANGNDNSKHTRILRDARKLLEVSIALPPEPETTKVSTQEALKAIGDGASTMAVRAVAFDVVVPELDFSIDVYDLPGYDVVNPFHQQYTRDFVSEQADALFIIQSSDNFRTTNADLEFLKQLNDSFVTRGRGLVQQDATELLFVVLNKWKTKADSRELDAQVNRFTHTIGVSDAQVIRTEAIAALLVQEIAARKGESSEEVFRKYGFAAQDVMGVYVTELLKSSVVLKTPCANSALIG